MSASAGVRKAKDPSIPGGRARLDWIDWIRGFAILLVVFYHAVTAFVVLGYNPPHWAEVVNVVVAPYRMPLLMFLSGTLLSASLRKPRGQYVIGKLRRIGWPYLVWTTVIVVFLIASSQLVGNGNYKVSSIPRILTDPATYTWYLAYLLVFYLLALATTPMIRALSVPLLFGVAFVVNDGDGWSRVCFLLAFFFLGDVSSRFPAVWARLSSRWAGLAISGAAVVLTVWLSLGGAAGRYQASTLVGVVALLVVTRAVAVAVAHAPVLNVLTSVGRDSIIYYTVHWVVIAATAHLLALADVRSPELALIVLLVAGLIVPWAFVVASRRWNAVRWLFEFPAPYRGRRVVV